MLWNLQQCGSDILAYFKSNNSSTCIAKSVLKMVNSSLTFFYSRAQQWAIPSAAIKKCSRYWNFSRFADITQNFHINMDILVPRCLPSEYSCPGCYCPEYSCPPSRYSIHFHPFKGWQPWQMCLTCTQTHRIGSSEKYSNSRGSKLKVCRIWA